MGYFDKIDATAIVESLTNDHIKEFVEVYVHNKDRVHDLVQICETLIGPKLPEYIIGSAAGIRPTTQVWLKDLMRSLTGNWKS